MTAELAVSALRNAIALREPQTASRGVVGNRLCDSWWRQVMAIMPSGALSLSRAV